MSSVRWTRDEYRRGDHNVIDDRTGFKRKRSECQFEWSGLLVHRSEWEPRHPQDFVKGRPDRQTVADPRPEPSSDTFISAGDIDPDTDY